MIPPDQLLLDNVPNLGPLMTRWEINKLENCWYKCVRILDVLQLLFQQFLNLSSSQRDMSGPIFEALSNKRWLWGIQILEIMYVESMMLILVYEILRLWLVELVQHSYSYFSDDHMGLNACNMFLTRVHSVDTYSAFVVWRFALLGPINEILTILLLHYWLSLLVPCLFATSLVLWVLLDYNIWQVALAMARGGRRVNEVSNPTCRFWKQY